MIEFRIVLSPSTFTPWAEATPNIRIHNIDFTRSDVRIDGVVYEKSSPEFIEAFNKAITWEQLNHD